jgi:hypothetical protein
LEPLTFWVDWPKNICGSHPERSRFFSQEQSWSLPRTIVEVLYCVSESTSHAFIVFVKPYHKRSWSYVERSSNPNFYINICQKPDQLIIIHFDLFTYKYPTPLPSSPHFCPFQSVSSWVCVCVCVCERERERDSVLEEFWSFIGFSFPREVTFLTKLIS